VKSFDFLTKRWTDRRSMNNARFSCGVFAIGAKIYVCGEIFYSFLMLRRFFDKPWLMDHLRFSGGYTVTGLCLNTIEYMDTKQNVWTSIRSPCPHNLGMTTISHFGYELFVCGW